jgi:hypothetical protein
MGTTVPILSIFKEVIMSVAAYSFVTLADVRSFLSIKDTDVTNDTLLEGWIDKICSGIEDRIKPVKIKEQTFTGEIYDGDGDYVIFPRAYPVTQIGDSVALEGIQTRPSVDGSWSNLLDDADDMRIDPVHGKYIELLSTVFPDGTSNVKLTYKAGYTVVPGNIWRVALEMVAELWQASGKGNTRFGLQSEGNSMGGSSSRSFKDYTSQWDDVIQSYVPKSQSIRLTR